jgi:transcriptional regulator with XRE-family HTH domain
MLTAFGERVRALRIAQGWSGERLARESSLTISTVSKTERGEREPLLGDRTCPRYYSPNIAKGHVGIAEGAALRERREAADLSVGVFAQRCRLRTSTVEKIERGANGDPAFILIFCDALALPPSALLAGLETPKARWFP